MNEAERHQTEDAALLRVIDAIAAEQRDEDRRLEASEGDALRARLLAGFDAHQRRRRRTPFAAVAEAFGWDALLRPLAPAGILAALSVIGFIAGSSTGADRHDEELVAALDLTFADTMENDW